MLMHVGRSWKSPHHLMIMALAGAIGALGFAYFTQLVLGWPPCKLCIAQRIPYGVIIALSIIGVTPFVSHQTRRWLIGGCVPAYLATAGIGAYHMGIEMKWWQGPGGCTVPKLADIPPEQALQAILNAPMVKCDDPTWLLEPFITMAGGNALYAGGIAVVLAIGIYLSRKPPEAAPPKAQA